MSMQHATTPKTPGKIEDPPVEPPPKPGQRRPPIEDPPRDPQPPGDPDPEIRDPRKQPPVIEPDPQPDAEDPEPPEEPARFDEAIWPNVWRERRHSGLGEWRNQPSS